MRRVVYLVRHASRIVQPCQIWQFFRSNFMAPPRFWFFGRVAVAGAQRPGQLHSSPFMTNVLLHFHRREYLCLNEKTCLALAVCDGSHSLIKALKITDAKLKPVQLAKISTKFERKFVFYNKNKTLCPKLIVFKAMIPPLLGRLPRSLLPRAHLFLRLLRYSDLESRTRPKYVRPSLFYPSSAEKLSCI